MSFFNEQTINTWIEVIGSFSGTLVAALFTVFIYKHQVKLTQKKEAKNEYEMFMKFEEKYKLFLNPMMNNLDLMEQHLDKGNTEEFKRLVDINMDIFEVLKKINISELPYIIECKFRVINNYLELILFQTALYKNLGRELHISNFSDNLKQIKDVENEINDYRRYLKKRAN